MILFPIRVRVRNVEILLIDLVLLLKKWKKNAGIESFYVFFYVFSDY